MSRHRVHWWVDLDFFFVSGGYCIASRIDMAGFSLAFFASFPFVARVAQPALHTSFSFLFLSLRRTGYPRV